MVDLLVALSIIAVPKVFCCILIVAFRLHSTKTVDTAQRAALNGLATFLGGSIAKGGGPIVTGVLVSNMYSSTSISPEGGSVVVFFGIGTIGLAVMGSLAGINRR